MLFLSSLILGHRVDRDSLRTVGEVIRVAGTLEACQRCSSEHSAARKALEGHGNDVRSWWLRPRCAEYYSLMGRH